MKNNKLFIILLNLLNRNFSAITNFLISFIIMKFSSSVLWGELVYYMSLVQVGGVLLSWGGKDYLLKEFSINPKDITRIWQENILLRLLLLFAVGSLFIFLFPVNIGFILFLWISTHVISKYYEVFIYYNKSFLFSLLTEFLSLLLLILFIISNKDSLDISYLLISYTVSSIFRVIMPIIYFKMDYREFLNRKFNINDFKYSFSFLLLAFTGIMNSKVDIFCINYSMNKADLGNYQVFFSFLMLIQNVGHLLVEPFAKNFYRMREESLRRIKWILAFIGPVISSVLISITYFIISVGYGISFEIWFYIYGFFFCLPVFVYSLRVYKLFKFNNQHWLIYISAICLILNVILDLNTIPYWGITGVIFSGMLVQWFKLSLFIIVDNFVLIKSYKGKVVSV